MEQIYSISDSFHPSSKLHFPRFLLFLFGSWDAGSFYIKTALIYILFVYPLRTSLVMLLVIRFSALNSLGICSYALNWEFVYTMFSRSFVFCCISFEGSTFPLIERIYISGFLRKGFHIYFFGRAFYYLECFRVVQIFVLHLLLPILIICSNFKLCWTVQVISTVQEKCKVVYVYRSFELCC